MEKTNTHKNQGFTLVEILVVIAIIGMISGVVMVSLQSARAKGRDAKRKADLTQLQKALALYENTNNSFPYTGSCPGNWGGIADNANSNFKQLSGPNGWIPGLAPTFVSVLPTDPTGRTNQWSGYLYCSDGTSYKLLAHDSGPESFPQLGDPFYDPTRPTWSWAVWFCAPGVQCQNW